MNRIWINGQSSQDIDGLLIQELPPITKPAIRTNVETIDGRDGDVVRKLGYSAYTKKAKIGLYGSYDVDKVIEFFNQDGEVVFSNEPDKYYNFQILEQIDYERLMRFKQAEIPFRVQPFKYDLVERQISYSRDLFGISQDFSDYRYGISTEAYSTGEIFINGTSSTTYGVYIPIKPIKMNGEYSLIIKTTGIADRCYFSLVGNVATESTTFGEEVELFSNDRISFNATAEGDFNSIYLRFTPATNQDFMITVEVIDNAEDKVLTLFNRGNYKSVPKLAIRGDGIIDLWMHTYPVCRINLDVDDEGIIIDGATMNAYSIYGNTDNLMNRKIECDFREWYLPSGYSDIVWDGEIKSIVIDDFSRWI